MAKTKSVTNREVLSIARDLTNKVTDLTKQLRELESKINDSVPMLKYTNATKRQMEKLGDAIALLGDYIIVTEAD